MKKTNKNQKTSKVIYYLSIVSLIVFLLFILGMLKEIFASGWKGYLLVFSVLLFMVCELYQLIVNKEVLKISNCYNIFMILISIYSAIIYFRIYIATSGVNSVLYDLNMTYCENNYLILSVLLIVIVINSRFLVDKKV